MSIAEPIKIGPWGGNGGTFFDVTNPPPTRLDNITIRAAGLIDSIGFSYVDEAGNKRTAGPFGGTGGQLTTIQFAPNEWVTKLSGTIVEASASEGKPTMASLEFETNIRKYGPYGTVNQDYSFSIPLPKGLIIAGFFGRAGRFIDAIGVYIGYKAAVERLDAITIAADEETLGN
ncbi:unnamed protein product [Urochloa decumbens]|uniref:Jacalin-type lectin domain-containing protein n=1 Tax=Urochloa decumbens TaxID=240449 RepID=A0ABC9GLQ7_9POAL